MQNVIGMMGNVIRITHGYGAAKCVPGALCALSHEAGAIANFILQTGKPRLIRVRHGRPVSPSSKPAAQAVIADACFEMQPLAPGVGMAGMSRTPACRVGGQFVIAAKRSSA